MHSGQGERERLLAEVRRIESLLRSALGIVSEAHVPEEGSPEATVSPPAQGQPEEPEQQPQLTAAPTAEPEPAPASGPVSEEAPAADDVPGWPPLRKVAQGGSDFDWGD
jgi:hypothetical protein